MSGELRAAATPTRWEQAYQRFETPEEEIHKFTARLRDVGAHEWDRSSSVVEVCSGRGNGLAAWRRLGFDRVYGVDLSLALVATGRPAGCCALGDARMLPVLTSSVDVVVIQGGLHHLDGFADIERALDEMSRILRPGGRVVIVEPWNTPFLMFVHWVTRRRLARAFAPKIDALATMIEEERATYEAWLSAPVPILAALRSRFVPILMRRRRGKLVLLGRPADSRSGPL
jgi:ubiquinone/menaquinone biosynthesis C-methylase UbiE